MPNPSHTEWRKMVNTLSENIKMEVRSFRLSERSVSYSIYEYLSKPKRIDKDIFKTFSILRFQALMRQAQKEARSTLLHHLLTSFGTSTNYYF